MRPVFFSQVKVVKIQRIFCAVAATHHATAAGDARGSRRTFSLEKWIRTGLAGRFPFRRLEDAHLRRVKGVPSPGDFCNSLQQEVGRAEDLVSRTPQDARGDIKVPGLFRFPTGKATPRS